MSKTPAPSPSRQRSLDRVLGQLSDSGYTPSVRDVDALIDLLVDAEHTKNAARALGRLGSAALDPLALRLATAAPPVRAQVARTLGRLLPEGRAVDALLGALVDADPKTRRNAVIALGHVSHASRPDVEDALVVTWERDPRPEMRRSIAASLGKGAGESGSARALALLAGAKASEDAELARIAGQARAMVERTASRGSGGRVDPSRAPERATEVLVTSRRGLEGLLAEELSAIASIVDVRVLGPGAVRAHLAGSLGALFAARTMQAVRFPLPAERLAAADTVPDAVARALAGDAARAIFATWTVGTPRYRVAWADGAHRRAATWDVVRATAARVPGLVNDPRSSTWEIEIAVAEGAVHITVGPRALDDPRFTWRRGDVPAASHPTIAAALARVAGVREDDVVWDPFVGSGTELVERALLGPQRALFGSDVDPRALAVASANLAAAGFDARLEQRPALHSAPPGVTLIVTNPPMGRRAVRAPGLAEMLDQFVGHAAASLERGGRLVWIAPWPDRSRAAGRRAGLALDRSTMIDMGGFDAELQVWLR